MTDQRDDAAAREATAWWERFKDANPPRGQAEFYYKDNAEYAKVGFLAGYDQCRASRDGEVEGNFKAAAKWQEVALEEQERANDAEERLAARDGEVERQEKGRLIALQAMHTADDREIKIRAQLAASEAKREKLRAALKEAIHTGEVNGIAGPVTLQAWKEDLAEDAKLEPVTIGVDRAVPGADRTVKQHVVECGGNACPICDALAEDGPPPGKEGDQNETS